MKLVPSLGEVRALAGPGRLVPVYAELLADLETPVSAYVKLAAGESYSFLLESVEGASGWDASASSGSARGRC